MSVFTSEWARYGGGEKAPINGVSDATLVRKLQRYKRNVAKRYRAVFNDSIQKNLPSGKLLISRKLDGELWYLVKKEGEVALCANNGRALRGIEVVEEAERLLEGVESGIVAGELFAMPEEEGRERVHHVARALAEDERAKMLGYRAFDVLELEGEDAQNWLYYRRLERLRELFGAGNRVNVVETREGESGDALSLYDKWVLKEGGEGLVVRSEHGFIFKIKPSFTLDAVVLAFGERKIGGAAQIRELTVGLRREDGSFHILGTVGSGWKEVERLQWHEKLSRRVVPSSFRMANKEGTLCRFVRPEVVVEIKCTDLVVSDASDVPIGRMTLQYDEEEGYRATGPLPLVSMLYPVFVRERADKTIDVGDIGLDQVYRHVVFEDRESEAERVELPRAEVLSRRVFSKTSRGNLMVRKYVAVKTNKEEVEPLYAPYVVHFTDYSSGRKDALTTSLRVAGSMEGLEKHIEEWMEKNIKRGWNEVRVEEVAEA